MFKRIFDIVLSLLLLILLLPILLLLGLMVVFDDPGPVFYKATRIGRKGQPFKLFKFRSMRINADKIGPKVTTAGDNRITRVGKYLRLLKLDELPQLANVLRGEMSLVGPRPEDPKYVELYTAQERQVLDARPGITSLASVRYRHEEKMLSGPDWEDTYINHVMRDKLALDLQYVQNPSARQDARIIWQTFLAIFN